MNSFYSDRILKFIDADSGYFKPVTAKKFAKAGEYFADLAEVLDYSSQRWLNDWLNETYGENEYCEVDHDWEDWLASRTQQSVSVAFLAKYKQERPDRKYPKIRETWSKEFSLDLEPETDLAGAIATAHAEDVALWSSLITEALTSHKSTTFAQLTQTLDLSPAQIYLGIVLSDRFIIIKGDEDDFYGGFSISSA
ncbi:MAG: hypothetical protein AAFQ14_04065 [Cyanobacteria bacterium J06621_12]